MDVDESKNTILSCGADLKTNQGSEARGQMCGLLWYTLSAVEAGKGKG